MGVVRFLGVEHGAHGLEPLVGQAQEEVRQGLHGHRRVHDLGVDRGHLQEVKYEYVSGYSEGDDDLAGNFLNGYSTFWQEMIFGASKTVVSSINTLLR